MSELSDLQGVVEHQVVQADGKVFVVGPSEVYVETAQSQPLKWSPQGTLDTFDASYPFRSPLVSMAGPRLDRTLLVRARGASRESRPRQTRRTTRVASRGDPPRSDDPDEDDVAAALAGSIR